MKRNSDILPIPTGYTWKFQPMDVSLNKPFKAVLRGCWVKYVVTVAEGHCVESVRIRSYSGPYFPTFGLNVKKCGSNAGKYGPE